MDTGWPLMGREEELAACRQALDAGDRGAGGIVFVGETGVGLTALARAAAEVLRDRGSQITWLSSMAADSSVPLCALAPVLPTRWRPEDHPLEVINAVAERFAGQGGRAGAALIVDDAHLLDRSSAALVAQLAVRRAAFVVLTVHRGQSVYAAITMLWKDSLVRRIDVPPLPGETLDTLMDLQLGGAVDGVTRHRLRRAAAGRPAVLRELLATGVHSGALSERFGVWRWKGQLAGSLRVTELVASRLEALPAPVRHALEVVAVAGGHAPLSIVEQMVEPGAVAAAERSGLLRAETSGKRAIGRLTNPLHGHAIRELTPATTARTIVSALVSAMAATPMRRHDDAVTLARWQRDAGIVTEPSVLLPAARLVGHSDPALAEWCAREAREAGGGTEADLLLAWIFQSSGRPSEAAALLESMPATGGRYAATAAAVYYWGLGRRDLADAALDSATAMAMAEPDRALAEAMRSRILLFDGEPEAALEVARTVLTGRWAGEQATAWASAVRSAAAGLLGRLDVAAGLLGRPDVATGLLGRLDVAAGLLGRLDVAPEPPGRGPVQVEYGACAARFFCGDVVGASAIADAGYRAAASAQSPLLLGGWALLRGVLAVAAGKVVTAQGLLREAASLLEESGTRMHTFCLAQAAGAAALAGATGEKAEIEADEAVNRVLRPWHQRALAWVLVGNGLIGEAVTKLNHAAAEAVGSTAEVYLLYDLARLGAAAGVQERLSRAARRLGTPFAGAIATCAQGLAVADHPRPELIARAAKTLADLGHLPLAAEAMSVAARAARRLGHRSRALLYVEEAAALNGMCERLRTPLLSLATSPTLTPREREILIMAAGHTSPQIAARLGVAVSTVNNHLANAYAKLGIAGRRELVALLGMDSGG